MGKPMFADPPNNEPRISNGTSISEIAPYKVGDVVYIKDPWGIGPKDQEVGVRCFSFHKAAHITGVIKSAE